MFSKMKSIFSRKPEAAKSYGDLPAPVLENEISPVTTNEPTETDPLAHMRDDPAAHASITSAAISLMAYMVVNPRKAHLIKDRLGTLVIALSEVTGLTRDQAAQTVTKFSSEYVDHLMKDDEKRNEFIRNIEEAYSDIDFRLPEDEEDTRDFSERLPDEYRAMLDEHMKFSEWSAVFKTLSPFQVGSIGAAAIQESKCAAFSQIHFWNAVIDHLLTSAFMAPDMKREGRVVTIKMATKYQDILRAMAKNSPDLLKQLEQAWEATVQHGSKMQEYRDLIFAERKINKWGQPINHE